MNKEFQLFQKDNPDFIAVNKVYETNPELLERYPGATKILSGTKDMSGLDAWRARVGDEEADRILLESQVIGNSLDMILYEYFKPTFNEDDYKNEVGFFLYKQLKPRLKHIDPIGLQIKIWSDKLKVMGYLDCLCYYKGVLSLVDFKNSKKIKTPEYLEDYYLQCTIYCMLLKDMFGINVRQIVLLIGIRENIYPQVEVQQTKDYVREAIKRIKEYYRLKELTLDKESSKL